MTLESLKRVMDRLATPTGGRALFTDSIDELHDSFNDLLDELGNQYLLGYVSTNNARDDAWRKIKVDVDGHHEVARAGLSRDGGEMTTPRQPINRGARKARRARFCLCVLCALCGLQAPVRHAVLSAVSGFSRTVSAQQPPPQPPRFQSSVEVTSIDVTVVDDRGKPITDLSRPISSSASTATSAAW